MLAKHSQSCNSIPVGNRHTLGLDIGPDAVQSMMLKSAPAKLVLPYLRAMPLALLLNPKARMVLNLGLGSGCLHRYIRSLDSRQVDVLSVDASRVVIDLAINRFGLNENEPIVRSDAMDFVRESKDGYDIIFCDLCTDHGMPSFVREERFYRFCKMRLQAGGIMAINLFSDDRKELVSILAAVRRQLPHCYVQPIAGYHNTILFAGLAPMPSVASLIEDAAMSVHKLKLDLRAEAGKLFELPVR